MRLAIALLWLVSAVSVAGGAEIQPGLEVDPYRVVWITPGPGERVFVLPDPGANPPLKFERFKGADGRDGVVGEPGRYFVFWFAVDADAQGQATITIKGKTDPPKPGPGPDPPGPDPGPGPDESSVPNEYGVGLPAYREAVKLGRKDQAAKIADVYESASSWLAATIGPDGETADISAAITRVNRGTSETLGDDVAQWQPWRDAVRVGLTALYDAGRSSRDAFVGALAEVGAALRLAAK